ncbi:HlyD family secretion protein [soil metagenome]
MTDSPPRPPDAAGDIPSTTLPEPVVAAPAAAAPVPPAGAEPTAGSAIPPAAPGGGAAHWEPPRRHPVITAMLILVVIAIVLLILRIWDIGPFSGTTERTDNAYVRGRTTVIAPQVSGYVVEVLVHDYQFVEQGQVLVRIDDRIYRARVEQARATLAAQQATLDNYRQSLASRNANVSGQQAARANAEAQLLRAQADIKRVDDLVKDGSVSVRERDQTLAALKQAEAQVRQAGATTEIARQDVRSVEVGRAGLEAQVAAALAQLHLVEVDLDNTVIRAADAGQLGEVGVRLGQYVTNGTVLVSLVPRDRWIIANFKEAQLRHMREGQPVRISVDALGGDAIKGTVERLSPAAGSEFAVIKPDNATGNFVKLPQRIGVRIAIDGDDARFARLAPGMSVEVGVDTKAR